MTASFEDIWNGSVARETRKSFLEGKFPEPCLVCPLYFRQKNLWDSRIPQQHENEDRRPDRSVLRKILDSLLIRKPG
jgi:hypothetical protein